MMDEQLKNTQVFLEHLLRLAGAQDYSAGDAQRDAQECWGEITADNAAQGNAADTAFFEFIVAEDRVGVFIFFEETLSIYVIDGNESDFRALFEPLAMVEVEAAKALLAARFAKPAADLIMDPTLSAAWLGVEREQ